ncbi:MAG TPA: metallophosphoesterase [Verrucomicrobiae bacterium]|nr:metallophosphoesterase [Verrucomicrobiae bacterium]
MDKSRLQIEPGIWVDARRAIWFERLGILAVADLHIGYNWAHRHGGQMLPLHQADDTIGRLRALCDFYKPDEFLLLGDVVHRALPLPQIESELENLLAQFPGVRLIAGNHDRFLEKLIAAPLQTEYVRAGWLFVHGHLPSQRAERVVMGHEHPAVSVGDGVATSMKCPCFLISRKTIVLPAFSLWAAGGTEMALREKFERAVAILGDKLLPIPLK